MGGDLERALVPGTQGLVIGAGVGAATLGLGAVTVALAGWPWWAAPAGAAVAALVAGGIGAVTLTLSANRRERPAPTFALERPPLTPLRRTPVTIEVVDPGKRRIRYLDVDLSDDDLARLARAVLAPGAVFSRRALPAGLLSADQYQALTTRMLKAGLLAYRGRGPEAGVELTAAGRAWLRHYV